MIDLLSTDFLNALGWTLFHSLWQFAAILLITIGLLRVISTRHSGVRYKLACAALLLFVITSLSTFVQFMGRQPATGFEYLSTNAGTIHTPPLQDLLSQPGGWDAPQIIGFITTTVNENMPWLLVLWALGFLIFSIRLSGSLLCTWKIRASAVVLDNEWNSFIADAAAKLGIRRLITLAEGQTISSPLVIGYFKPVILVPAGIFTGLSATQLEMIFLHELAHIRRHDYLINLFQSVVETIFFFNPFVWVLSNIIRREREYCCDDMVVRYHGDTKAYAHALTRLAEARLAFPGFALALAGDRNQLLNRIKRIMERSSKNYSGKGRIAIPVILLLGALMSISWLGTDKHDTHAASSAIDTLPADSKRKAASYSRKSIMTIDEQGRPHEEVVEEFEGDESLRPLLEKQLHAFPNVPQSPDFGIPGRGDTIPPVFGFRNSEEWEELTRSFEENFRKKFEQFEHFREDSLFMHGFAEKWRSFEIPDHAMRALEKFENSEAFKQMEEELMRLREFDFDRFRGFEDQFAPFGKRSEGYENALRDQLLKDGYLSEGESIESLEWSNDSFKVNGKSIREADRERYRELNSKFFGGP